MATSLRMPTWLRSTGTCGSTALTPAPCSGSARPSVRVWTTTPRSTTSWAWLPPTTSRRSRFVSSCKRPRRSAPSIRPLSRPTTRVLLASPGTSTPPALRADEELPSCREAVSALTHSEIKAATALRNVWGVTQDRPVSVRMPPEPLDVVDLLPGTVPRLEHRVLRVLPQFCPSPAEHRDGKVRQHDCPDLAPVTASTRSHAPSSSPEPGRGLVRVTLTRSGSVRGVLAGSERGCRERTRQQRLERAPRESSGPVLPAAAG